MATTIYNYHPAEQSREIPVLMYHHIMDVPAEEIPNSSTISYRSFRNHIERLAEAGFHTISFADLIAYVDEGRRLPPRAVLITFDDGYRSNLTYAAPVLAEHGMQATISVIGISRGQDTHWRTGDPIIPHFTWDEVRPWVTAGVIDIQHHSHDMHQSRQFEPEETFRVGALQREGESDEAYRAAFFEDFRTLAGTIEAELGTPVTTYVYPHGRFTETTEAWLQELGVRATVTTEFGLNTISRLDPEGLFLLKRINMTEARGPEFMIQMLETREIGSTKLHMAN